MIRSNQPHRKLVRQKSALDRRIVDAITYGALAESQDSQEAKDKLKVAQANVANLEAKLKN